MVKLHDLMRNKVHERIIAVREIRKSVTLTSSLIPFTMFNICCECSFSRLTVNSLFLDLILPERDYFIASLRTKRSTTLDATVYLF